MLCTSGAEGSCGEVRLASIDLLPDQCLSNRASMQLLPIEDGYAGYIVTHG